MTDKTLIFVLLYQMSLLYNLFIDSGILPMDLAFRQTEFLCEASSSIVSSLADSNPDIGSQLAVRLLIPYSVQQKNVEIIAAISNILDHYYPTSGEFATTIVTHALPLLDLKSVQVMESCVSVVLCAYRSHKAKLDVSQGASLLLKGIELESKVLTDIESGFCFKILAAECQTSSLAILRSIAESTPLDTMHVVATSISNCFGNEGFDYSRIPQASALLNVIKILECYRQIGSERTVGDSIIACLEQHEDSAGAQRYNAPVCVQWYLLRIACQLIYARSKEPSNSINPLNSPFDKKALGLLMERLMDLGYYKSTQSAEFKEMEEILTHGFGRSIITENSLKMGREVRTASKTLNINSLRSVDLDAYDVSIQEQLVKRMLGH